MAMTNKGSTAASTQLVTEHPNGPSDFGLVPDDQVSGRAADIELALDDLIGDSRGEVVFCNDSSVRSLAIATDAALTEEGIAGRHTTSSGSDVSGYRYLTFAGGITLYVEPGVTVVVVPERSD